MNNSINTISILILCLAFLTMAVLALYLPKITEGISKIIVNLALYLPKITEGISKIIVKKIRGKK